MIHRLTFDVMSISESELYFRDQFWLTYPVVAGMAEGAPKLNPVVVEDAGAAAAVEPKLKPPLALESSVLAAPEPKEKGEDEEVV